MDSVIEPIINNWYRHLSEQLYYCIIDIDETAGILEIQHADGDIDTLEIDSWHESGMELATAPEHWGLTLDDTIEDTDEILANNDVNITAIPISLNKPEPETNSNLDTDAIEEDLILKEWLREEAAADSG